MPGSLKAVDPIINVKNVAKSSDWYQKMLGLKVEMAMPDPKQPSFVRLTNGQIALMISDGSSMVGSRPRVPAAVANAIAAKHAPKVVHLFFRVDDGVDAIYRSVRRKGAKIIRPIADQPYGICDFAMRDPDGFEVAVGQDIRQPRSGA